MDRPFEEQRGLSRSSIAWLCVVAATLVVVAGAVVIRADDDLEPDERLITLTTESCGPTAGGIGTGVLVGNDLAVTVAHVALTGSGIVVEVAGGPPIEAELVGLDRASDIAVLRLSGVDAGELEFTDFSPGEAVRIVGGQSGVVDGEALRAVDITIEEVAGTDSVERNGYEVEAELVKGDSGAGVFDLEGRLGGIVFAVSRRTAGVTWITDASEVRKVLDGELERLECDPARGFAAPVP